MAGGADDQQRARRRASPRDRRGDGVMGKFNNRIGLLEGGGEIVSGIDLSGDPYFRIGPCAFNNGPAHAALRAIDQEAQRRHVACSQGYLTRLRLRNVASSFAALAGAISQRGRRNSPAMRPARLTAVLMGMGLVSMSNPGTADNTARATRAPRRACPRRTPGSSGSFPGE